MAEVLASIAFTGAVVEWRGPAPFLFVSVPDEHVAELRYAARAASYGWGCVPATARIGATDFTTSLFPRADTYFVPVKVAVQRSEAVALGDVVDVAVTITRP